MSPRALWEDPYAAQATDLLQQPAKARAAALQQIASEQAHAIEVGGNAQANAAIAGGQAWSGAAQQIGQIPQQIQAARENSLKMQGLKQQVDAGAQQASDLKALDNAFQQPGGRDAIINSLPGHLRPQITKQFNDADESSAKVQAAQLASESATNEYVSGLAESIKAHDYDPAATQLALSHAKTTFKNNPSLLQQVGQMEQALQSAPTSDTVKSIVDPILAAKEAKEKAVILPATPREGGPAQLVKPSGAVVATGSPAPLPPAPKTNLEPKLEAVIKGTTNVPSFEPSTGKWMFNGAEVPPDQIVKAAPPKDPMAQALQAVALANAQQNLTDKQRRVNDVKALADGMKSGDVPPDPEGLQRNGLYGDVVAELHNQGINFNTLRQQYMAQKRLINTENSPQGVRLDIAVRSGKAMYDKVDTLADQWQGMGLGPLSRLNLKAATEGALGQDAQKLAVQLTGQIAQLTSDVATVEQNGMTPTNEARDVASKSLQDWWGNGTIKAMTAQGRANMNIRDAARKETIPVVPGQAGSTPPAGETWVRDASGKLVKK